MTDGVTVDLAELINLQRFARPIRYRPDQRAARSGHHLSNRRGRGMDFSEVRNYQAGDEIRHMEWRMTARTGKPHIKLYQEERERPVVLVTDFNPSMHFGTRIAFKSVIAARLTALLAWTVVKQGDCVGGLFFSASEHHEYMPRSREAGVLTLLTTLSQYTQTPPSQNTPTRSLLHALKRLNRVARPGSTLVLISDFYQLDRECALLLARLRQHNDLLAYHICDPLELSPPKPQRYAISNGEEECLLDIRNSTMSDAYQHDCDERLARIKKHCLDLQIQRVQIAPTDDLSRVIHNTFPGRAYAT